MKILAVAALLCALMALTPAAPAPEAEPEEAPAEDPRPIIDPPGPPSPPGMNPIKRNMGSYDPPGPIVCPGGPPAIRPPGMNPIKREAGSDGPPGPMICPPGPPAIRPPGMNPMKREEALEDLMEVVKRGWSKVGGRNFFYESKEMSWQDADRNCLSMNLRLVSVHTREETQHIQYLMGKHGAPSVWLGSFYSPGERRWVWADGTKLRYEEWCNGAPYTSGNMRCLQMTYSNKKQCWDGDRCDYRRPSLCA
ncbi:C-type lectin domain family 4 member K-like [Halichoeres trimaculatus]|uniref:C-type lectin domain family 4 member K-like n=1 Tax=Halichoeres trimaculatus TaxID=147232 RepID=UPI003D9FB125